MKPIEQQDLYKFNMVKDRRRRLILPIGNTDSGYHISDRDMKKIGFLNAITMWVMLAFVMSLGLFKLTMWQSVLIAAVVGIGFEVYKRYFFLKDKAIIKITESDMEILHSVEASKVQRSDARMEVMFGFTMILLVVLRLFETGGYQGLDFIVAVLALSAAASFIVKSVIKWRTLSKRIKASA